MPEEFRNPYVFVPLAQPCGDLSDDNPLGQDRPAGHDRFHADKWSGRVTVEIVAVTPLLIPDGADVEVDAGASDHKTFDVRRDAEGAPLLPITTYKGALRSAYEAVTNSRFGAFEKHDAPPARRMRTDEALKLVPVRIVKRNDVWMADLWTGTTAGRPNWRHGAPLHAAWLPFNCYRSFPNVRDYMPTDADRLRGRPVTVRLQKIEHKRWVKASPARDGRPARAAGHVRDFDFWEVVSIVHGHDKFCKLDGTRQSLANGVHADRKSVYTKKTSSTDFTAGNGYVFWSKHNIDNKHDERVFFIKKGKSPQLTLPLSNTVGTRWAQLIQNYQAVFEQNGKRSDVPEVSRHIDLKDAEQIEHGMLCYAEMAKWPVLEGETPEVKALYPVTIGRELGRLAPKDLLPPGPSGKSDLLPASSLGHLSPADRVFGWVRDKAKHGAGGTGKGAYKGQLRVHLIECLTPADQAIESFPDPSGKHQPLPLAILGAPKIAQARFYVGEAETTNGKMTNVKPLPERANTSETAYFAPVAGTYRLRGRKVYPHHGAAASVANYWNAAEALEDARGAQDTDGKPRRVATGNQPLWREYLRRPENPGTFARDSQNRSIRAWIAPGTTFRIVFDVINMSKAELGGVLWLADLSAQIEGAHLRLGGGKPLGFGSVTTKVMGIDLETGAERGARYANLAFAPRAMETETTKKWAEDGQALIDAYTEAVVKSYGNGTQAFKDIPFIAAFLQSARGHAGALPTHYPRTSAYPDPAGENYKWFVSNEKRDERKHALPSDGKLPILPPP